MFSKSMKRAISSFIMEKLLLAQNQAYPSHKGTAETQVAWWDAPTGRAQGRAQPTLIKGWPNRPDIDTRKRKQHAETRVRWPFENPASVLVGQNTPVTDIGTKHIISEETRA